MHIICDMYKVTHLTEFEGCGRFHGRMSYDSLIFYLTVVLIPKMTEEISLYILDISE